MHKEQLLITIIYFKVKLRRIIIDNEISGITFTKIEKCKNLKFFILNIY